MTKTYLEIETNSVGVVVAVRRIDGARVEVAKKANVATRKRSGDSPEVVELKAAIARDGATKVAERLGLKRCAIYQWLYRGRIPAAHADKLNLLKG